MAIGSPEQAVEVLDAAFNRGDIDTVLGVYEDQAAMVVEPGRLARGKAELRSAFEKIMASGFSAKQEKTYVIEAGGIALFLSRWTLSGASLDGAASSRQFIATTVFRKQPNGEWRAVIDNSFGPLVLDRD